MKPITSVFLRALVIRVGQVYAPQKRQLCRASIYRTMKTYPAILSRLECLTSSPKLMMALPMTPIIRGSRSSWIVFAGPAMAKINFRPSATVLAPNTGAAMNFASLCCSSVETSAEVSGCTVEQSTITLAWIGVSAATKIDSISSLRTWSFVTWEARHHG